MKNFPQKVSQEIIINILSPSLFSLKFHSSLDHYISIQIQLIHHKFASSRDDLIETLMLMKKCVKIDKKLFRIIYLRNRI